MSTIGSLSGSGDGGFSTQTTGVTAATALTMLRKNPAGAVTISDTAANIQKNLDALQKYASKVTSLSASDSNKNLTVSASQYTADRTLLNLWGAGSGQTVAVTGAKASTAGSMASYVTSVSVADSATNIQSSLDNLNALVTSGLVRDISQLGTPAALTVTVGQVTSDAAALGAMKNHAYSLNVTGASVSDALGLGANPALGTNAKVKSIAIVDTTDNIKNHLDALQKVGLRIKSLSQTDAATPLTVTGAQYSADKSILNKFISSDHLAVLDASAAQSLALKADHKVISLTIKDTASNLSRNWATMQGLGSALTSVQVTNQTADINLTVAQLSSSDALLAKFADDGTHSYNLAVTGVSAADATSIASTAHVDVVDVSDDGSNIVGHMDELQALNTSGQLRSIAVALPQMTMDVSAFQGAQADATNGVLDKIKRGAYRLAVTGAGTGDIADLTANHRIASIAVTDTSANIESSLDDLNHLGSRLASITQTDSGTALNLTQTQFDSRAAVLSKIAGGYSVDLTGVTAAKAITDARNVHVAGLAVADNGRNIAAHWSDLLSLGNSLDSVTNNDNGAVTVSAQNYFQGIHDDLVSKFDSSTTFSVNNASVAQAQTLANDDAVVQIDLADWSTTIAGNLLSLEDMVNGGKLHSIINQTAESPMSMDASQLSDAQPVLDLIRGGSYKLALTNVDAGDAHDLATSNHKIVSMAVTGDGGSIVANLADLTSLGNKVTGITDTDGSGTPLELNGSDLVANQSTLGKIEGGFTATLDNVNASQAAMLADNASVIGLNVTDTAAHLSSSWDALKDIGDKLTGVSQTGAGNIQLNVDDWLNGQDLRAKFDSDPTVAVSGASVDQVDDLASDDAVQGISVSDSSEAISDSLSDLLSQSKVTGLVLDDPSVALTMSASDYQNAATLLSGVQNHQYTVDLSGVSVAAAGTLASDAHVSSMEVTDSSANISSHFDALAAASNLGSITLSNEGGTLSLTSAQILGHADTLGTITNAFDIAATGVAVADLPDIENVSEVSSIAISDSADNVSASFDDIVGLRGQLTSISLTDASPVLSLSEQDWSNGSSALSAIGGSYQVDVSDTAAGDASTVAADAHVRNVSITDSTSNVSSQWDALVSLYNGGSSKLNGISLADGGSLRLSVAQQSAGADLISNLLPDAVIDTI